MFVYFDRSNSFDRCLLLLFVCKVVSDCANCKVESGPCLSVCMYLCVCVCVCVSVASDSWKTVKVIIVKLSTVTASDLRMHHVLIILTLTCIQGHTDRNHEHNKCLIISETIEAMPITFAVDSPTKVLYDHCQSNDLDLHSRSQVRLKLDYFLTCNISDNVEVISFILGMTVDLWMP